MKLKNHIIRWKLILIEFVETIKFKKKLEYEVFDLWIEHDIGGGILKYCEERIANNIKSKKILRLRYNKELKLYYLENASNKNNRIFIKNEKKVLDILKFVNLGALHIHSLVSYPSLEIWLKELIKLSTKGKKIFYAHDYYPICPKINMVDETENYCRVNLNHCAECLSCVSKKVIQENPYDYRSNWHTFLERMDDIILFSNSTKEIYQSVFPDLGDKIRIKSPYLNRLRPVITGNKKDSIINIGVIGNINSIEKGRNVILDLAHTKDDRFKIFIYGSSKSDYKNNTKVENRGRYKVDDLPLLLQRDSIDYILIPSICPETFSYTTTEAIMMGLPVVCFDLGAQGEKVRNYSKGILLEKKEANSILATLLNHYRQTVNKNEKY